jgi:hypothetical protein
MVGSLDFPPGVPSVMMGTLFRRPTRVIGGQAYYATDTAQLFVFYEGGWFEIDPFDTSGTSSPPYFDDFQGTVLSPDWTTTINGAGNVAMLVGVNAVAGGAVQLQDTGAAGAALVPSYEVRTALSNVTPANGTRTRAILHNAGAWGAVGNWFGFEFNAATSANWISKATTGGGAVRSVDTGIPATAGIYNKLRLDVQTDGTITVSIDSNIVDSIPAASVTASQLEPLLYIDDGGLAVGAALNMAVDYVWAKQNRS